VRGKQFLGQETVSTGTSLVLGQASRGSYISCERWLSNLSIKSTKVHLPKNIGPTFRKCWTNILKLLSQHSKNVEPAFRNVESIFSKCWTETNRVPERATRLPVSSWWSLDQLLSHTELISGSKYSHTIDYRTFTDLIYYSIRGHTVLISEYKPIGLIAMQTENEMVAKLQAGLSSGSFSAIGKLECSTASVVPPIVVDVILRVGSCIYLRYPQGRDRSTSASAWSVYVDAIRYKVMPRIGYGFLCKQI